MKREIGGYFELERNDGSAFYDYLAFNSSRNCLQFLIQKRKITRIYLPYFLCKVVEETCKFEGILVSYYHIDEHFLPILEIPSLKEHEFIYLVNYYGLLSKKQILNCYQKYQNLILDNTHAFFQKGFSKIDTIYNCRKYFGVPDGAYLYTSLEMDEGIPYAKSSNRFKHLIGRFEETAEEYYSDFKKADASFDYQEVMQMSSLTSNLLKGIPYLKIHKIRRKNVEYLKQELSPMNQLNLKNKTIDFMYPFCCSRASELRKFLQKEKIYIPKLWPNLEDFPLSDIELKYVEGIVAIPIDQRYTMDDMKFIVDKIKLFYGGEENDKN